MRRSVRRIAANTASTRRRAGRRAVKRFANAGTSPAGSAELRAGSLELVDEFDRDAEIARCDRRAAAELLARGRVRRMRLDVVEVGAFRGARDEGRVVGEIERARI